MENFEEAAAEIICQNEAFAKAKREARAHAKSRSTSKANAGGRQASKRTPILRVVSAKVGTKTTGETGL